MSKIGFISVCHKDYVSDTADAMALLAVASLRKGSIKVEHVKSSVVDNKSALKSSLELLKKDIDGIVVFLGTWVECSVVMTVVRELEHLPICLWGFPMFMKNGKMESTGSYVSYAMFKGTMDRVGYNYKGVLGLPDNQSAIEEVLNFCSAAKCRKQLKRTRIGLVGYTSMSIYPGTFDHVFMRAKIGPEIEHMDSYTVINRAEKIKDEETEGVIQYLSDVAKIRNDVSKKDLVKVSKLYLSLKGLATELDLNAMNVKCQAEFSKEYGMVMCVPLSILAEDGVVSSCEGDMLNTVSMIILGYLSGNTVTYGDVIHHDDEGVLFSSCGFIPYSFGESGKREIRKFFPHPGFKGIQNSFVLKKGKVTIIRLVEDKCDYHILMLTGNGLDTDLRQGYMPALKVKLDGKVENLVKNYAGQHFAICYGDYSKQIIDLCSLLGINVVTI
jgi:L-fucose isomerase-like protein